MDNYELKQQNIMNNKMMIMNEDGEHGLNGGVGTCGEMDKFNDVDAKMNSILLNDKQEEEKENIQQHKQLDDKFVKENGILLLKMNCLSDEHLEKTAGALLGGNKLEDRSAYNLSETNINSCNTSTTSVSSNDKISSNTSSTSSLSNNYPAASVTVNVTVPDKEELPLPSPPPLEELESKSPDDSLNEPAEPQRQVEETVVRDHEDELTKQELYDKFDVDAQNTTTTKNTGTMTTTIKRTHLINLIFELYDLNEKSAEEQENGEESKSVSVLVEGYMEKLPPGKNLKNSILLAWKRRYFKLNSIGVLYVHDIDDKTGVYRERPDEVYNIMGGRVEYEQNKIISLDDCRGNYLVFRCVPGGGDLPDEALFMTWRNAIESQIVDRSHSLWVRPNQPLNLNDTFPPNKSMKSVQNRNVVIIDIGTCSIRAGLFEPEPKLPKLFVPTVCSKDVNGKVRVGFDAFDFLLGSSAPSTIDLRKSMSAWSLNSSSSNQLIFPFKTRIAIDKLGVDMESIDAIINYVVENLNINCVDYEVVVITTHKLSDKVNVQFLNLLLENEKYRFKSATIINQTLMDLYAYNSNIGIIANLGEKIDIVPICNGLPFQNGVTNLAYGGSCMSEFLNSYISRGHVNYVNDMEQFYIRYIKEKSCYVALNYQDELKKYPNDLTKYIMELKGRLNEFKKVEFPESARFKAVEGLFNPEIWGLDGQGIHKLIQKAIQSSSMDLRREMARNIFLCGGMSRIPGLKERLEKELRQLFPPNLTIKVNCSDYSYHLAYLGAFRFIQQPEYEKLLITSAEWQTENVNCLRKWRSI